jgi:hypothetical protein
MMVTVFIAVVCIASYGHDTTEEEEKDLQWWKGRGQSR